MLNTFRDINTRFTDTDKENCKPVIARMLALAETIQKRGVMSIESCITQEDNLFLKTAIKLAADASDLDDMKRMLQYLVLANEYSNDELLSRLIIAKGILAILSDTRLETLQDELTAMLGETYYAKMVISRKEKKEEEANSVKTVQQLLKEIEGTDSLPEVLPLELLLWNMPDSSVRKVLSEVDDWSIRFLMHGCGYQLVCKMFAHMSEERRSKIVYLYGHVHCVQLRDIKTPNKEIIDAIFRLEKNGEISLR